MHLLLVSANVRVIILTDAYIVSPILQHVAVLNVTYLRLLCFTLQALDREVRIRGDLSELYISDETFSTGDLVVVFSTTTQESFHGIITALTHHEVVIRSPTGVRFKILVGQLRTGRVSMSKDKDTVMNAQIFNTAADMQAAREKYI